MPRKSVSWPIVLWSWRPTISSATTWPNANVTESADKMQTHSSPPSGPLCPVVTSKCQTFIRWDTPSGCPKQVLPMRRICESLFIATFFFSSAWMAFFSQIVVPLHRGRWTADPSTMAGRTERDCERPAQSTVFDWGQCCIAEWNKQIVEGDWQCSTRRISVSPH